MHSIRKFSEILKVCYKIIVQLVHNFKHTRSVLSLLEKNTQTVYEVHYWLWNSTVTDSSEQFWSIVLLKAQWVNCDIRLKDVTLYGCPNVI